MKIKVWKTDRDGNRLALTHEGEMQYINTDVIDRYDHTGDVEANVVNIHDDIEYQTVGGIGGAISDSAAMAWSKLSGDKKEEFVKAYFDREQGIGYTFGRLSMASCDFSSEDYTYVDEGDMTLESFDISHDKIAVFPLVKAAEKYGKLTLFASPWSPPAYMKTNGSRIGGKLKKECYPLWAKYFRKYIEACAENGISIWGVTMQNEPRHHQMWESCLYTPEEEIEFLGYLGEELEGKDVKIICYDHCRERTFERAKMTFESENGKYCDGVAHHWYSGDHFGELRAVFAKYPDKVNIASEGCNAVKGFGIQDEPELRFAEIYAHDILGCFNNGLTHYCDWNITLDEKNGPFHNREGRGCSADTPVYCVAESDEIVYRLAYYYIGHFSKFVYPGAKVVATSSYIETVEAVTFKNPDGSLACVMLNRSGNDRLCRVRLDGHICDVYLKAHSIATAVIESKIGV